MLRGNPKRNNQTAKRNTTAPRATAAACFAILSQTSKLTHVDLMGRRGIYIYERKVLLHFFQVPPYPVLYKVNTFSA